MGYRIRIINWKIDSLFIMISINIMIILILGSSSCYNSSIQKLILVQIITLRDTKMMCRIIINNFNKFQNTTLDSNN